MLDYLETRCICESAGSTLRCGGSSDGVSPYSRRWVSFLDWIHHNAIKSSTSVHLSVMKMGLSSDLSSPKCLLNGFSTLSIQPTARRCLHHPIVNILSRLRMPTKAEIYTKHETKESAKLLITSSESNTHSYLPYNSHCPTLLRPTLSPLDR
jgi:hypothetical protein